MAYCENNSSFALELINIIMLVNSGNLLRERERERERDAGVHKEVPYVLISKNFIPKIVYKFTILGKFACTLSSRLFDQNQIFIHYKTYFPIKGVKHCCS